MTAIAAGRHRRPWKDRMRIPHALDRAIDILLLSPRVTLLAVAIAATGMSGAAAAGAGRVVLIGLGLLIAGMVIGYAVGAATATTVKTERDRLRAEVAGLRANALRIEVPDDSPSAVTHKLPKIPREGQ